VDPQVVINDAVKAGLQLTHREDVPPFIYLLVFGVDPASQAATLAASAADKSIRRK
jgi:hypothetical protein